MNDDTIDSWEPEGKNRPSFLTVLCIFTWLVSALTLITAPSSYFVSSDFNSSESTSTYNEMMMQISEDDAEMAKFFEPFISAFASVATNSIKNAGAILGTDILTALLSAIGAFFMFKLRKQGFWIYLGAKVLSLASVFLFLGVNIATVSIVAFSGFVGLIFVAFYAMNLKFMA